MGDAVIKHVRIVLEYLIKNASLVEDMVELYNKINVFAEKALLNKSIIF